MKTCILVYFMQCRAQIIFYFKFFFLFLVGALFGMYRMGKSGKKNLFKASVRGK